MRKLVIAGAIILTGAAGFVVGRLSVNQPEGPALETARLHGFAIPEEQIDAFADGKIMWSEVEEAVSKFTGCLEGEGVEDYSVTLTQEPLQFGYSLERQGDAPAAITCETRYVRAIWQVFDAPGGSDLVGRP